MKIRKSLSIVIAGLFVLPSVYSQVPSWWNTQGVISENEKSDFSPVNQGQLKNMAWAAMKEIGADASPEIHSLVTSWYRPENKASAKDFAAINVGQLKAVAAPFYLHLGQNPPWTSTAADDKDFSLATIGQLKTVFNFEIPPSNGGLDLWDKDGEGGEGDGLPDLWEIEQIGDLGQIPGGDADGDGVINSEDARPSDINIGAMAIHIANPANGATIP